MSGAQEFVYALNVKEMPKLGYELVERHGHRWWMTRNPTRYRPYDAASSVWLEDQIVKLMENE
jgi:hypothetical protein